MVDWEFVISVAFVIALLAGFAFGLMAVYQLFKIGGNTRDAKTVVGVAAFGIQYLLVLAATFLATEAIVPTLLHFLVSMGLAVALWMGLSSPNRAGVRIALASVCTGLAYSLAIASTYF